MLVKDLIEELIVCPKKITKVDRKKMTLLNRSWRNNASLSSEDDKYQFKMILRKSDEFTEDFSVGLIWTNPNEFIQVNKNIILMRCQGPHDSKVPEETDIHHSFHIHQITDKDIASKRYLRPAHKCITKDFASFEQAAWFFVKKCNIISIEEHLDYPFNIHELAGQTSLF